MGKGWDDLEDGYGRNTKWLRTWRNQELQMPVFKKRTQRAGAFLENVDN